MYAAVAARAFRRYSTYTAATLAELGIAAHRSPDRIGIWVDHQGREAKVGAIGVRIARWVTSHGFALNVTTDLRYFELIVPCGITDKGVTSLAKLTGRPIQMDEVEESAVFCFRQVFQ